MKTAVIVIPTYNEAGNIEHLIPTIFETTKDIPNWSIELLIVDSNSPDKTGELIKKLQKKYSQLHLLETEKEGLGKAYLDGFRYAMEKLHAFVIMQMDADGQHDPKKIPEFLDTIAKGADIVIGSRYRKGGSIPRKWGIHRKFLSVVGNQIIRLGFMKLKLTDWTGGYRATKAWLIKDSMSHIKNYSGYIFQMAALDYAIKKGAIINEIPIQFKERTKGESKINYPGYITQIFLYMFTHSSFIKFALVGALGFIVDFGISYILIEKLNTAIWLGTLISTESAIACNFILNNFWSFSHKKLAHGNKGFIFSFLKFNFISSGSIIIQTLGIHFAAVIFGEKYWYIYKVIIIVFVIIPYSYILYNKFIWKDRK